MPHPLTIHRKANCMRWNFAPTRTPDGRRDLLSLCAPLLCLLLFLSVAPCAAAQEQETVRLRRPVGLKLRLKRNLNSGRVRIGDYVEFEVVADVRETPDGGAEEKKIIEKGTPAFGQVLDRHNRFTILKRGAFSVGKVWTTAVDGKPVQLDIRRPTYEMDVWRDKESNEGRPKDRWSNHEEVKNNFCVDKTRKENREKLEPCVKGRVYAGSFIANLPSAVLAVATATTLARVKDAATSAVVGVTLADKLVSQAGISNIINGVDAEMEAGEVFDAATVPNKDRVIKLDKPAPDATKAAADANKAAAETIKAVERVGRFTAPTPAGYIVTDYFSDVVSYPSPPGQQLVYTGKVIERHTDRPAGSKMNMCDGQSPPLGWVIIDRPVNPNICPREPGDKTPGPAYSVILKTP